MKRTLLIPQANGEMDWEVEAEIVGDLAVHEAKFDPKKFTVTHVPTLLGMSSVVPEKLSKNRAKLMAWAEEVQLGLKKDWLAMRKYDHAKATAGSETEKLRERIRNHCRSVQ